MLLAIDTATPQVSVCVWTDDGPVASSRATEGRRHGEVLVPAVQALVSGTGHTMADLTAVAVDVGPGLFTGLRVGVATAKALAHALDLPTVGLTSLEILAHPHRRQPAVVASVVDARRHEVFRALYRTEGNRLVEMSDPSVLSPDALAAELDALARSGTAVLAVGDGARRYADVLCSRSAGTTPGAGGLAPPATAGSAVRSASGMIEIAGAVDAHPGAEALAELAAGLVASGRTTDAGGLHPCYLRSADVRIGWDRHDLPEREGRGTPAGSIPAGEHRG